MITLARSEPKIAITPDRLDADPWLLNIENGTIDLKSCVLQEHRRDNLLTKLAPVEYDRNAKCPKWDAFLTQIFAGNQTLVEYVQRLCGYCLTGVTTEQILPIFWGSGANGKSTLLNTLLEILGDYASTAPADLLMARKSDGHPTAMADLFGRRLVACCETDESHRLNEALVKSLTGSDRIRARKMHRDHFEFAPSHKLVMATNHRPTIRGTDHAIWRRIRLVPFTVTIPAEEQDKELPAKLLNERAGILNWLIAGCLEWQRKGLGIPPQVEAATAEYREQEDDLGLFIAEHCTVDANQSVTAQSLLDAYKTHTGDRSMTAKLLGHRLKSRGYTNTRATSGENRGRYVWTGIGLSCAGCPA